MLEEAQTRAGPGARLLILSLLRADEAPLLCAKLSQRRYFQQGDGERKAMGQGPYGIGLVFGWNLLTCIEGFYLWFGMRMEPED